MVGEAPEHRPLGATKIIDRIPKPGMEKQLEAAIQDVITAMGSVAGFSAVHVLRPAPPEQPAYRIICTFDTDDNLSPNSS